MVGHIYFPYFWKFALLIWRELLLVQAKCHQPEHGVVGRNDVWRIRRVGVYELLCRAFLRIERPHNTRTGNKPQRNKQNKICSVYFVAYVAQATTFGRRGKKATALAHRTPPDATVLVPNWSQLKHHCRCFASVHLPFRISLRIPSYRTFQAPHPVHTRTLARLWYTHVSYMCAPASKWHIIRGHLGVKCALACMLSAPAKRYMFALFVAAGDSAPLCAH